ncbi:MAG: alpha-glucosidase C-terminal domain-containing protein, partial [Actinomycetota bacterium]|nr:alpha-glucosidase C-terminal domain-containing protein [Actinomycetota bacterium]
RRSMPVLGIGKMEVVDCPNPAVLAFVRWGDVAEVPAGSGDGLGSAPVMPVVPAPGRPEPARAGEPAAKLPARTVPARPGGPCSVPTRSQAVLCVHNLSRFAQPALLDLAAWEGRRPIEVLGRVSFPAVGSDPYSLALGPHGFLWFDLSEDAEPSDEALP